MRKIVKESENAFNYEAYFFNHWRYIDSDITHTISSAINNTGTADTLDVVFQDTL